MRTVREAASAVRGGTPEECAAFWRETIATAPWFEVVLASNAIGYAKFYSNAVIRAYDNAGNVNETHERWRQAAPSIFVGKRACSSAVRAGDS